MMKNKFENKEMIMDGAEVLYSMIQELTEGIAHLPGCRVTANLKQIATSIKLASNDIYEIMKNLAIDEDDCDESPEEDAEYYDTDSPDINELKEFLDKMSELINSDKPISVSANIYINEEKDDVNQNEIKEAE